MMIRQWAPLFLLAITSAAAPAQSVRGIITDQATGRSLPGVIVTLLNDSSRVVARSLSGDDGQYRIGAPRAGRYILRALRIGFRPGTTAPFELAAGVEVNRPIALGAVAMALDTVRVASRSACRVASDTAMATYRVWEQVRGALTAADVTGQTRGMGARVITYERALDLRGRVARQTIGVRSAFSSVPWTSLPPDSLRAVGYVVRDLEGATIFYAPDLAVLLSDEFIEDHCMRIVGAGSPMLLGIAFEPTEARRRVADIA
ncbi:MAG TPA: carboxypeptidase-like regulatory domain-containing protein, partial [Gemmatimonadaceae bacterium]|nr:carboxypeptidase-like regulatory domain-containing protein [Gemmatimonadaceae bacterium]